MTALLDVISQKSVSSRVIGDRFDFSIGMVYVTTTDETNEWYKSFRFLEPGVVGPLKTTPMLVKSVMIDINRVRRRAFVDCTMDQHHRTGVEEVGQAGYLHEPSKRQVGQTIQRIAYCR